MYNRNDKINYGNTFISPFKSLLGGAAALGFTGIIGAGSYLVLNSDLAASISRRILKANNIEATPSAFMSGTKAARANAIKPNRDLKIHIDGYLDAIERTNLEQERRKTQAERREAKLARATHIENLPEDMNPLQYQVFTAKMRKLYKLNKRINRKIYESFQTEEGVKKAYGKKIFSYIPRKNPKPLSRLKDVESVVKNEKIYKYIKKTTETINDIVGVNEWHKSVSSLKTIMTGVADALATSRISDVHNISLEIYNEIMNVSANMYGITDALQNLNIFMNPRENNAVRRRGAEGIIKLNINYTGEEVANHYNSVVNNIKGRYNSINESIDKIINHIEYLNVGVSTPPEQIANFNKVYELLNTFKEHLTEKLKGANTSHDDWDKIKDIWDQMADLAFGATPEEVKDNINRLDTVDLDNIKINNIKEMHAKILYDRIKEKYPNVSRYKVTKEALENSLNRRPNQPIDELIQKLGLMHIPLDDEKKAIRLISKKLRSIYGHRNYNANKAKKFKEPLKFSQVKSISEDVTHVRKYVDPEAAEGTVEASIEERIDKSIENSMKYVVNTMDYDNAMFAARHFGSNEEATKFYDLIKKRFHLSGPTNNNLRNELDKTLHSIIKPKSTKEIIKKITDMFKNLGIDEHDIKVRSKGEKIVISGIPQTASNVRHKSINFTINLTDGNIHFRNGNVLVTKSNILSGKGEAHSSTIFVKNPLMSSLETMDQNLRKYYELAGAGFSDEDLAKINQIFNIGYNTALEDSIDVTTASYMNKTTAMGLTQDESIKNKMSKIKKNRSLIIKKQLEVKQLEAKLHELELEHINNYNPLYIEQREALINEIDELKWKNQTDTNSLLRTSTIENSGMASGKPIKILGLNKLYKIEKLYNKLYGIFKPNIAAVSNRLIPKGVGNFLLPWEHGYNTAKGISSIRNTMASATAAYQHLSDEQLNRLHLPKNIKTFIEESRNKESRVTLMSQAMFLATNYGSTNYVDQEASAVLNVAIMPTSYGGDVVRMSASGAKKLLGRRRKVTDLKGTTIFGLDLNNEVLNKIDFGKIGKADQVVFNRDELINDNSGEGRKLVRFLESTLSFNDDTDLEVAKRFLKSKGYTFNDTTEEGRKALKKLIFEQFWDEQSRKAFRKNVNQNKFKDVLIDKITVDNGKVKVHYSVFDRPGFNSKVRDRAGAKTLTEVVNNEDFVYTLLYDTVGGANVNEAEVANFVKQVKDRKIEAYMPINVKNHDAINLSIVGTALDSAKDVIKSKVGNNENVLYKKLQDLTVAILDPEEMKRNNRKILGNNKTKSIKGAFQDKITIIPELSNDDLELLLRATGKHEKTATSNSVFERIFDVSSPTDIKLNKTYIDNFIYKRAEALGFFNGLVAANASAATKKKLLYDILDKLILKTTKGSFLTLQRVMKHSLEEPTDLFRIASNQVRSIGGVKEGVQVDLMSTMFLRMKGLNNVADRAQAMAATGKNVMQMYTANLLEVFGEDPANYLDALVLKRLGIESTAAKHLVLPNGKIVSSEHADIENMRLQLANANMTEYDKYQFLISGTGYKEATTAQEIDRLVSDMQRGRHDDEAAEGLRIRDAGSNAFISQDELNDLSEKIRSMKSSREKIDLSKLDYGDDATLEEKAASLKAKLREVNRMSSLLTKEELASYKKMLKEHRKILLPKGIRAVNTIKNTPMDYVTLLDITMQPYEEIGFDYTKLNAGGNTEGLYALNDVHMAQVKLTRLLSLSAELESLKVSSHGANINLSDTEKELHDNINNILSHLYEAKLHTFQVLDRTQFKPRLNGMQAIGHPNFIINQSKYTSEEIKNIESKLSRKNVITKKVIRTGGTERGIFEVSPKIGTVGISKSNFVKLITNGGLLNESQANKIAEQLELGHLTTFATNKREPLLSQNSIQSLELALYDTDYLGRGKSAADIEAERTSIILNKLSAEMVEGDFDRDIYSLIFSIANGTYFNDQTEALASYVQDHIIHVKTQNVNEFGKVTTNGRYTKYVFNLDRTGSTGTAIASQIHDFALATDENKVITSKVLPNGVFDFIEKKGNESLKNSIITANDFIEKKFANIYGMEELRNEVTDDAKELINMIDAKGDRKGEYTATKLREKLEATKRSLAKDIFDLSDDELKNLSNEEIEAKLKTVYMLDTSTEYYKKLHNFISKDMSNSTDKLIKSFNAYNIKNNITDNIEVDIRNYFRANTQATEGEITTAINHMKTESVITADKIAKTRNLVDSEAVKAFTRIKQATGLIYNFVHGSIDLAAADAFGINSKTTKLITRLSYAPQQINISAKHMLPAIAVGWMESVKVAAANGGSVADKIINNLSKGNYFLTDKFAVSPVLKENERLINHAKEYLKNKNDDNIKQLVEETESNLKKHKQELYFQRLDDNYDVTNFTTDHLLEAYNDQIRLNEALKNTPEADEIFKDIDYQKNMEYLKTVTSGIEKAKAYTTKILNTEEKKKTLRSAFNDVGFINGINNYGNSFVTKLVSNRVMDFSNLGNVHGLFNYITNTAKSYFSELFSSINDLKTHKHINPESVNKFMDDSLIHKITTKAETEADEGFAKRLISTMSSSGIIEDGRIKKGGIAGAFMGALFGVVAAIGASSSKRRWLGHQTGVGGEAYDYNKGKQERRYSDKLTSEPTIARMKDTFTPSNGMVFRQRAMLRRVLLSKPRKTAKEEFKEIMFGDRDFMFAAQTLGEQSRGQSYVF